MNTVINRIDRLLNNVTMYRLLVYTLSGLIALSLGFSLLGPLPISPLGLFLTAATVLGIGYVSNQLLAWLYRVPANHESGLITSLILVCILPPVSTPAGGLAVAAATLIAIASKYILAFRRQHIINPAAAGAIAVGLIGLTQATWWIGNPTMLPFVLLAALLVWRKLRLFHLAGAFLLAALATMAVVGWRYGAAPLTTLESAFTSWPLIFLAGFMLTEPSTMPAGRRRQIWFGVLVGLLFGSQLSFGPLNTTPEVALAIGNIAFFLLRPKSRVRLRLKARHGSGSVQDLEFTPERPLLFRPGQYMEWTLPDDSPDARGNRRSFTIASSPTEKTVHLGVKHYDPSSAYKRQLQALRPGDTVWSGQITGDFVLPKGAGEKLLFIAGGVGITPFRSMVKYMLDKHEQRDAVLLYLVNSRQETLYEEIFEQAAQQGVRTHYVLAEPGQGTSQLDSGKLERLVPDYQERLTYLAGPDGMVRSYKTMLKRAGLSRRRVITDYFSGY